jgi:hypothetical protein
VRVKEAVMFRFLPLLAAAGLLFAGCAQQPIRPAPDPFLGEAPAEKAKGKDADFVGRPPDKPADPPVATPAGTAEIASGPSGVSLGSPRSVEPKPADKSNSLTPVPPPGSGAPLEQEKPVSSAPGPVTQVSTSPGPVTYEQLQTQLRARGVSWQQLQCMGNDSWHFICAIPDPSTPGVRENFEVTRTGNMGLNAMQAVVEQIDKERSAPPPQAFER